MSHRKIPQVLDQTEQEKLLESFNTRYITPTRNRLMVKLMLDLGLRVGELTALEWSNIDLSASVVDLKDCKGGKDRRVYLNPSDRSELALWRNEQNEWLESEPVYVFTTKNNTKVSERYVRAMMKRACEKAGLDSSYHPHTLRHTFATDLYRKTKDIRMVQKALGHSDIHTTMIYTHIVDDDLEEEMKNLREPVMA